MFRSRDDDGPFIKTPLVTGTWRTPADPVRVFTAEFQARLPDRRTADRDVAHSEHVLNHSQAQRARVADDLSGVGVARLKRISVRQSAMNIGNCNSANPSPRQIDDANKYSISPDFQCDNVSIM